jgi:tetratricopeptide (TPR) repeat protein
MPAFGRSALFTAFAVAAATTVASAQDAPKNACSVDENSPSQLAIADLDLAGAAGATPEAAAPKLKDAIKRLEQVGDRNPNGHALVLGKTLVLWLAQPDVGNTATRGSLGFTTNPDSTINLLYSIDSTFTLVENVSPDCAASVAPWRQQKPWVDMLKASIDAANAQQLDTAEVLANNSLQLYRGSPYAYMVLGQVAAQKGNSAAAVQNFQEAADRATDTSMVDTKRQALLQLGQVATLAAKESGISAADKATLLGKARTAFQALLNDPGASQYADQARKGVATVAVAMGDTAAIRNSYAPQLANPSGYNYSELMQAAVAAGQTNAIGDATKLFEAALKLNPYGRDVLYNLSLMYVKDSTFDKVVPLGLRLVSVDPANESDYGLLAFAYAHLNKTYEARSKAAAKTPSLSKALADSARMAIDSALKFKAIGDSLPAQVVFSSFSTGQASVSLAGNVMNQTDKPTTYTIKVDFLDNTGAVVQSQSTSVGPVPAKGTGSFSVKGAGPTIEAFRYTVTPTP